MVSDGVCYRSSWSEQYGNSDAPTVAIETGLHTNHFRSYARRIFSDRNGFGKQHGAVAPIVTANIHKRRRVTDLVVHKFNHLRS